MRFPCITNTPRAHGSIKQVKQRTELRVELWKLGNSLARKQNWKFPFPFADPFPSKNMETVIRAELSCNEISCERGALRGFHLSGNAWIHFVHWISDVEHSASQSCRVNNTRHLYQLARVVKSMLNEVRSSNRELAGLRLPLKSLYSIQRVGAFNWQFTRFYRPFDRGTGFKLQFRVV